MNNRSFGNSTYHRDVANNSGQKYQFNLPQCYIYLYHTDEYFILPSYPDSISDSLDASFSSQPALSRTAPVFSYSNSGPRTVQVSLKLHRDMMNGVNIEGSNVKFNSGNTTKYKIETGTSDDDYVDLLIRKLQTIALPRYNFASQTVNPPMVAVRFGDEIFIKGVVTSGVSLNYSLPLLENKKYAQVTISFTISEITPFDADTVGEQGSFRGFINDLHLQSVINDISARKTR